MQLKIKRRSASPVPQTRTGKNVVTENCYNKLKALGKTVKRKQQREYARKRRSSSTIRAKKPGAEDNKNLQNLEGKGKHLTPSKNGVLTVDKRLRIASKNGGC